MSNKNQNHIEVELRALVKDLKTLETQIKETGAEYIGSSSLHDIYFCEKSISTIEGAEMNEVGSYSIRIRKYSKDGTKSTTLNTKIIITKGDHHAWEEHETEVDDFYETAKILSMTEFKPFFELKKTRHEYKLNNLGIFVEDIKDFGGAIEVEILTNPGTEEKSKEVILDFLLKLGLSKDDVVPKSVTNIVMKQRAFKTTIEI
jgi:predicted adenylyl cyclase CyaB